MKLGFVPAGKEQVVLDNGVVEVLADIYGRWATGGGVGSVDINSVINQLSGLTAKYGNLFQVRHIIFSSIQRYLVRMCLYSSLHTSHTSLVHSVY